MGFLITLHFWRNISKIIQYNTRNSVFSNFQKPRGGLKKVWKLDETLFWVFDRAFQMINNFWRNSKLKFTKCYNYNKDHNYSKPPSLQQFPLFYLYELLNKWVWEKYPKRSFQISNNKMGITHFARKRRHFWHKLALLVSFFGVISKALPCLAS